MSAIWGGVKQFFAWFHLIPTVIRVGPLLVPILVSTSLNQIQKRDFLKSFLPVNNGHDLIRIGNHGDGGYLVPDDLRDVKYCFSPGVGGVCFFETHLLNQYGIKSFLLDNKAHFPLILDERIDLKDGLLGNRNISNLQITLKSWLEEKISAGENDLVLQMDIEGAEWECLLSTNIETLSRFRIVIIEFHGLEAIAHPRKFYSTFRPVIRKLTKLFDVVHFHPNNCCGVVDIPGMNFPKVAEVTFHNKNRRKMNEVDRNYLRPRTLPHEFDVKIDDSKAEICVNWI